MLRLVVAGGEVGGKLNREAKELLDAAAHHKAQQEAAALQEAVCRALRARWATLLAVATQNALASTLVNEGPGLHPGTGAAPLVADLFLDELSSTTGSGEEAAEARRRPAGGAAACRLRGPLLWSRGGVQTASPTRAQLPQTQHQGSWRPPAPEADRDGGGSPPPAAWLPPRPPARPTPAGAVGPGEEKPG